MTDFKRITRAAGIVSFLLFFGVSALLFFGFVEKETVPVGKVKFYVKEKARSLDIWRFSGSTKYRIKAESMVRKKNNVVYLENVKLWIYQLKEPVIFVSSDRAYVYPNRNVRAKGDVFLRRSDLKIYTDEANWNNEKQILYGNAPFHGYNMKSRFKGKSFLYYSKQDKLIAKGVDIWLK